MASSQLSLATLLIFAMISSPMTLLCQAATSPAAGPGGPLPTLPAIGPGGLLPTLPAHGPGGPLPTVPPPGLGGPLPTVLPHPRIPIRGCPRCACCAPPPAPGQCCPCFCPPPPPAQPPTY